MTRVASSFETEDDTRRTTRVSDSSRVACIYFGEGRLPELRERSRQFSESGKVELSAYVNIALDVVDGIDPPKLRKLEALATVRGTTVAKLVAEAVRNALKTASAS